MIRMIVREKREEHLKTGTQREGGDTSGKIKDALNVCRPLKISMWIIPVVIASAFHHAAWQRLWMWVYISKYTEYVCFIQTLQSET